MSFTENYAEEVAEDYAAGATMQELADAYGVSLGAIQKALDAAAIERRRPGPQPADFDTWTEADELFWQAFVTLSEEGHKPSGIAHRMALTDEQFRERYWALTDKRQRLGLD